MGISIAGETHGETRETPRSSATAWIHSFCTSTAAAMTFPVVPPRNGSTSEKMTSLIFCQVSTSFFPIWM
ncbi:hypothetical protein [Streptomyces sp. CA-256286]|uniref:hypothetical protein n=1 Tax=Streptomyces sp. CA-256286 TaxID=2801033 RepID=UPI001A991C4E|nr:hypothetical protein [Streptomyces sp. CA-256286]